MVTENPHSLNIYTAAVAVDLHADVLDVPHDCSLDEALHVVVVEGLGAGARGAILGSVGHAPISITHHERQSGNRNLYRE